MKSVDRYIFLKRTMIGIAVFFNGIVGGVAQQSDENLSQALADKIKKGSGDIVMRPSDLKEAATPKPLTKPFVQSTNGSIVPKTKVLEKEAVHQRHWSYDAGETGPENWGNLSKENSLCSNGKQQSPINLENGILVDLPNLTPDYKPSQLAIRDNGHTIMVDYGEGSNLLLQGKQYRLVQFHFHHPSEEMIDGKRYDMVAHLVHQHFDRSLLVLAIFLNTPVGSKLSSFGQEVGRSSEGKENTMQVKQELKSALVYSENPLFQQVLNNIPLSKNVLEIPSGEVIDMNQLLPKSLDYYTYMGSLTTPPCTENVTWIVLKEPVLISRQQLDNFARIYSNNARPIQPKADRLIKVTR